MMPIFRGIDMSVIASTAAKSLQEYPHPDGSSVHLVSPDTLRFSNPFSPRRSDASVISDGDPTCQRKIHPRISVYIPSMPGEQFWLRYSIIRSPSPATHLYFKMYLNGTSVTSWGLPVHSEESENRQTPIRGTVVRALYEPGDKWHHMSTDTEGRAVGIEARYFRFMPTLDKKSAAEDGGLIEIQVFRSKGRRRRAPKMVEFRNQEKYGISSPSGGLVEYPQDANFYDWLLIDPKDSPFASFRFHYRSMKYLLQLNLIPQSDSNHQLPRADSESLIQLRTPVDSSEVPESGPPAIPQFFFNNELLETAMGKDTKYSGSDGISEQHHPDFHAFNDSLEPFPNIVADQSVHKPAMDLMDSLLQDVCDRPLPDPPQLRSRHTSQSSVRSACPSLTPSLVNYVDNSDFGDEDIKIGTAHTVMCSVPSLVELLNRNHEAGEGRSFSDYEHSPHSSVSSSSHYLPSPERYLCMTGSVLERQIAQFTSPPKLQLSPHRVRPRIPVSASERTLFTRDVVSSPGSLSLNESEWMRQTPSPVLSKPLARLWSPRLGKKLGKLASKDHKRRSCCSDAGPYSSNENVGEGEREKDAIIENTELSVQHVSDEATTPRTAYFSDAVSTGEEAEIIERPVGNWI